MNIEIAGVGLLLSFLGVIMRLISDQRKITSEMRSELKENLQREAFQNQSISDCLHKTELLESKTEGEVDRLTLTSNGLLERINHTKSRLEAELKALNIYCQKLEAEIKSLNSSHQKLEADIRLINNKMTND